jgi:hypothetical protein
MFVTPRKAGTSFSKSKLFSGGMMSITLKVGEYVVTLQDKASKDVEPGVINSYDLAVRFKVQKGVYPIYISIAKWPTGNCQLSAIGYINALIDETSANKKDINDIIRACYRLCNGNATAPYTPHLAMIDVREKYIKNVEECFVVKMKYPYVSTNGSSMCLYMIQF